MKLQLEAVEALAYVEHSPMRGSICGQNPRVSEQALMLMTAGPRSGATTISCRQSYGEQKFALQDLGRDYAPFSCCPAFTDYKLDTCHYHGKIIGLR